MRPLDCLARSALPEHRRCSIGTEPYYSSALLVEHVSSPRDCTCFCRKATVHRKGIIPPTQYRAITQLARKTNQVERFNCTLRQRVSRPVRATLSFFKKLSNHIGAIRYFICD